MRRDMNLARDIIQTACAMDEKGFAPSKSGNVSARTNQGFLITPTGLPYASLAEEDIVHLDLDGRVVEGARRPSSEWRFHAAIYKARRDVGAVVHTHSPRATALSCARRGIPAFHYMIAMAGGDDIRCASYATFGTQALADHALAALEGRRACLLANHGVIAIGARLESAWALAQDVESLAGQYLDLLASRLSPVILTQDEMKAVVEKFADYGRD